MEVAYSTEAKIQTSDDMRLIVSLSVIDSRGSIVFKEVNTFENNSTGYKSSVLFLKQMSDRFYNTIL